jgi:putative transposase
MSVAEETNFEILAYCFMPDHIHLLVQGTAESSRLDRFMQRFKQLTGYHYKQRAGRQLWRRSYHDRVLRRDEDVHSAADYIWHNPVRAGLAASREEYLFSGPGRFLDRAEALSLRDFAAGATHADTMPGGRGQ